MSSLIFITISGLFFYIPKVKIPKKSRNPGIKIPNPGDKNSETKKIPKPGDPQEIPKKSRWSENCKNPNFLTYFKFFLKISKVKTQDLTSKGRINYKQMPPGLRDFWDFSI